MLYSLRPGIFPSESVGAAGGVFGAIPWGYKNRPAKAETLLHLLHAIPQRGVIRSQFQSAPEVTDGRLKALRGLVPLSAQDVSLLGGWIELNGALEGIVC